MDMQDGALIDGSATAQSNGANNGTATKKAGGVTGKGFKPGQSGNPAGRAKIPEDIRIKAMRFTGRALERITELIESDDERVAFMASKELLDRVYGRTKTVEDENGKDSRVTINIVKLAAGDPEPKQITGQVITLNRFSDGSRE